MLFVKKKTYPVFRENMGENIRRFTRRVTYGENHYRLDTSCGIFLCFLRPRGQHLYSSTFRLRPFQSRAAKTSITQIFCSTFSLLSLFFSELDLWGTQLRGRQFRFSRTRTRHCSFSISPTSNISPRFSLPRAPPNFSGVVTRRRRRRRRRRETFRWFLYFLCAC